MTVTLSEPDRLQLDGVLHRLVLHGIREQVEVNHLAWVAGDTDEKQFEERVAVDFMFIGAGTPSAMCTREEAIAIRDWLTAFLEADQ